MLAKKQHHRKVMLHWGGRQQDSMADLPLWGQIAVCQRTPAFSKRKQGFFCKLLGNEQK